MFLIRFFFLALMMSFSLSCKQQQIEFIYQTDKLVIEQLSENTYRHISYLETDSYGRVACNGLIVINEGEALVIDSPADSASTSELMTWIHTFKKDSIVGAIATHFHIDCLGGFSAFHAQNIPSYANPKTIELARQEAYEIPKNILSQNHNIIVGSLNVQCDYWGEGHTVDNIVCYIKTDDVLFGGCLIKALGSGKGNLDDANVKEWSHTVEQVKTAYPEVKIVVPGHGKAGDVQLLDYTIEMFKT